MLANRCYHRKGWILSNTCCYTNFDLKALYKLLNGDECHSRHTQVLEGEARGGGFMKETRWLWYYLIKLYFGCKGTEMALAREEASLLELQVNEMQMKLLQM